MPRDPFYNSRAWKTLRAEYLRQHSLCMVCEEEGRLSIATDVDHKVSINSGGSSTALDNFQSLCHKCHSRKTLYVERLGRDRVPVKGCRADGTPLDPQHHWNKGTSTQGGAAIVDPGPFKRTSSGDEKENLVQLRLKDRARIESQT
jgi:5-methylcytosine-specific restriction enzyme A